MTILMIAAMAGELAMQPVPAPEGNAVGFETAVSFGLDASSGDYGLADDTHVVFAPVSIDITRGGFRAAVSGAWATIDGPADIFLLDSGPAGRRDRGPAAPAADTERSGLTDLSVEIGWTFSPDPLSAWVVDISAGVSLPTGDEDKGLGSGSTDGFGAVAVSRDLGSASTVGAVAGYRIVGDRSDFEARDVSNGGVFVSHRLSDRATVAARLDWRQSSDESFDDQADAGLSLSWALNTGAVITTHVFAGLSDSSPAFGGGVSLRAPFGR